MSDVLNHVGTLIGHTGWVTSVAAPQDSSSTLVSGSRDKKVMVWELEGAKRHGDDEGGEGEYGYARRCLSGHNQAIADLVLSCDSQFALSGSWDSTMRLWDLNSGACVRKFKGHTKDVLSVAFSSDNRQIVSGSRDRTIRLWNTLAECKYTITEEAHTDWVSCVHFSPSAKLPTLVSAGWDKLVKVWNLTTCKLRTNLAGHSAPVYTCTISPDGSLCASGGKDATAMLWDINDGKHLYSLDAGCTINALLFSPKNYWLTAATDKAIIIWDLENKNVLCEIAAPEDVGKTKNENGLPWCVSLCWSSDGSTLFAGATDGKIYVFETQG